MTFSSNWIGNIVSQGERFVVQYLDRKFGGRIRRVFEVTPAGVSVVGDLDVSDGTITGDGSLSEADFNKLATTYTGASLPFSILSAEIDFTTPAVHTILAPRPGNIFFLASHLGLYTVKDGTVVTGPTIKFGTNATNDNLLAATAQTTFATQAQDTKMQYSGAVLPNPANADMSSTGYRLEITVGAVLGTATQCKAKIMVTAAYIL